MSGNWREVSVHPKPLVQIFTRRFRGNAWISVRDMAVTADPWDLCSRSHSTQCAERRAQLFGKQLREQTDRDLGFQLIDVPAGALAERTAPIQRISRELVSRERR
jgi:hypothetical protein